MERRMMVAGNWKMFTTSGEGAVLIQDIAEELGEDLGSVETVVCPPFTGLKAASTVIELDHVPMGLGARICAGKPKGRSRGPIAPRMLTGYAARTSSSVFRAPRVHRRTDEASTRRSGGLRRRDDPILFAGDACPRERWRPTRSSGLRSRPAPPDCRPRKPHGS